MDFSLQYIECYDIVYLFSCLYINGPGQCQKNSHAHINKNSQEIIDTGTTGLYCCNVML